MKYEWLTVFVYDHRRNSVYGKESRAKNLRDKEGREELRWRWRWPNLSSAAPMEKPTHTHTHTLCSIFLFCFWGLVSLSLSAPFSSTLYHLGAQNADRSAAATAAMEKSNTWARLCVVALCKKKQETGKRNVRDREGWSIRIRDAHIYRIRVSEMRGGKAGRHGGIVIHGERRSAEKSRDGEKEGGNLHWV